MTRVRIQIVEDERIVALNIRHRLEEIGYTVTAEVATGEEAIQIAAETMPDLVLMDIKLKGKVDGVEAASQIQNRLNIPVVYLTAYSDDETIRRAKLTEPQAYILKPFATRELCTAIELALYKHQMEQQLRSREQWLTTILKSIGDAVITTDRNKAITFMNPVAEVLTQWKQEEVLGKDVAQVFRTIHQKTREAIEDRIEKALREEMSLELANHTLLITKEGTEIPIDHNAAPIKKDDGNIIGAVLVFHDIIERQQAEDRLQRLNQELEARVTERTALLREANEQLRAEVLERQHLETQLQAALQKERELSELKSRIVTTISHEYRTPLTTILLSSELLRQYSSTWSDSRKNQHFQRIQEAIQKMTMLVNDVLFINQSDTRKQEFRPTQVNLERLIHQWVEEIKLNSLPQHPIFIELQGSCINALVDEKLFQLIFSNLLSNAFKYSSKGLPIRLKLISAQNQIVFRVSDEGIGIPIADQTQLFNAFCRGSNVGTIPGVGLGLVVVKQCVDLHGGEIFVESEVGVGTTFTITLPQPETFT